MAIFSITSFRTLGVAAQNTPLLALNNGTASTIVRIKSIGICVDSTAALATDRMISVYRLTTAPTGGTSLTANKVVWDSANTASNTSVTILGATASDGGAATTITATRTATNGIQVANMLLPRPHTVIGQIQQFYNELIPSSGTEIVPDIYIRPSQYLVLYIEGNTDATTSHYLANIVWEEV